MGNYLRGEELSEIKKILLKNLRYDLGGIIQTEFYLFMRENPDWYANADWSNPGLSYRFSLQANAASTAIMKYLTDNDLIVRCVQNTDTPTKDE